MASGNYKLSNKSMAWGRVRHRRSLPKVNAFDTNSCFVSLDFSAEPTAALCEGWPTIDEAGIISVQGKDYGLDGIKRPLHDLVTYLHNLVSKHTGLYLPGKVTLQTFPRVFGFVFNPVSFWYFHAKEGHCAAILCEVNNTFGERHFYLLHNAGKPVASGGNLFADKAFHVSPFFPVSGQYRFRFVRDKSRSMARIDYFEGETLQLSTSVSGELHSVSTSRWVKILFSLGWFTVAVVLKIHWQALKLWLKGAKFHTKPTAPDQRLTQVKVES